MKELQNNKKRKRGKRLLCVALALTLVAGSLGPAGNLLEGGETEAATGLPEAFVVPEEPGFPLQYKTTMNGSYTANWGEKSLAEDMLPIERYKVLDASKTGWEGLSDVRISGQGGDWRIVYEFERAEDAVDISEYTDDLVAKVGGSAFNQNGSSILVDTGAGTNKSYTENGRSDINSGWQPYDGKSNPKAYIYGTGKSELEYAYYGIADATAPGQENTDNAWEYEVVVDESTEETTFWLSTTEILRPVNESIKASDLQNLMLYLTLTPRPDYTQQGESFAEKRILAIGETISEDCKMIGFKISDGAWAGLEDVVYEITKVENNSTSKSYQLTHFTNIGEHPANTGELYVKYPVCDYAGNIVEFPTANTKGMGLYIDAQKPYITEVKLSGTAIDETSEDPGTPDQWTEDLDKTSLFSTTGDRLYIRVKLNERIKHPDWTEMQKVTLYWNAHYTPTQPVESVLVGVEDDYADGVNGKMVSTLVFLPLRVSKLMTPQGERIVAEKLIVNGVIRDESGNKMQNCQTMEILPDKQNYLDTKGPNASLGNVITVSNTEEKAEYTIPLNITDDVENILTAGIYEKDAAIAISSYGGAPQIPYSYEISRDAEFPEELTNTGVIGAEGNDIFSPFKVITKGTYYLHIRLTDVADKELLDNKGMTIKLQLEDNKGNQSTPKLTAYSLGLDHVAPKLTVQPAGVTVNSVQDGSNEAVFQVKAETSDLNGISRVEYQWMDSSAEPAGEWIAAGNGANHTFTDQVTGDGVISRDVIVRSYDNNNNMSEQRITMTADLAKAVTRYAVEGDVTVPSNTSNILISRPATSDAQAQENGSTRAIVTMGSDTYVRLFNTEEAVSLFDFAADDWYKVLISGGAYTAVESANPPADYYGEIQVKLTSSLTADFTPVEGGTLADAEDTTRPFDETISVLYAAERSDVHSVGFEKLMNSEGKTLVSTTSSDQQYTYYRINKTLAGSRLDYTLKNALVSEWGRQDVDFDNSYAVLLRTDENASTESAEEVSERAALSNSESQSFSIPSLDQEGDPFATGIYMLKIHVAQKGGGFQEFYADNYLILYDATSYPSRFGVLEHTTLTEVLGSTADGYGISRTRTAESGSVLSSINIGVVKPDNIDGALWDDVKVETIDGHPAYVLENHNALQGSKNTYYATGGVTLAAEVTSEDTAAYFGTTLGVVEGIRYWNKASQGEPAAIAYTMAYREDMGDGVNRYQLDITKDLGWYCNNTAVVSAEELAAKDVSDFAVSLGANTICYQLIMENGTESPVYQFQLNLCDQAPTIQLDYDFYDSKIEKVVTEDGTETYKYTYSIDVSVTDAFSPNGDVKLYHAFFQGGYEYSYTEIQIGEPQNFYWGHSGYGGSESLPTQFICAVDGAGNAVAAYPIFEDLSNSKYYADYEYYYVPGDVSLASPDHYTGDTGMLGDDYTHESVHGFLFNYYNEKRLENYVDRFTVKIDDKTPVEIQVGEENPHLSGVNDAGILAFGNQSIYVYNEEYEYVEMEGDYDVLQFVFPYDETKPEGEMIDHKVTLTFYGWPEEEGAEPRVETREYEISAANIKPEVSFDQVLPSPQVGMVSLDSTTYVKLKGQTAFGVQPQKQIYEDGTYEVEFTDKFGKEYSSVIEVIGSLEDPKLTVSETEPTKGPVVITAASENYDLYLTEEDEALLPEGTLVEGNNSKELVLTFYKNYLDDNGNNLNLMFTRKDEDGQDSKLIYQVTNIIETEIEPEVQWLYDESMIEDGNIFRGELTAVLVEKNGRTLIDPITNAAPRYTFVPGGETEYTFSGYTDEYGIEGPQITATLPVTLMPYETTTQDDDVYQPDVALTGYAVRDGVSREVAAAFAVSHERPEDCRVGLPDYETHYGIENVFDDTEDLFASMGWADSYLLRITAADENAVRLFVKTSEDAEVTYETGESDVIEGVTLTGRTIQIDQNTEFYLYAVDEGNHTTIVPMNIANLGEAPKPTVVQALLKGKSEARLYVVAPKMNGITNLTVQNPDTGVEDDVNSPYVGCTYVRAAQNGPMVVYYSYEYEGITYSGEIPVTVTGIDNTVPVRIGEIKWNTDPQGTKITNRQVTAQMKFDKKLESAKLTVAEDGTDVSDVSGITVTWLENIVTVIYDINMPPLTLTVVSAENGKTGTEDLSEVSVIDIQAPYAVGTPEITYSSNHRNAQVTVKFHETVSLQENGKTGTSFTKTATENGALEFTVTDAAGNLSTVSVDVTELVPQMEVQVSTSESPSGIIDPKTYEVKYGETLYVRANRAAQLFVNDAAAEDIEGDTWTAVVVEADTEGLYPCISVKDSYGNKAVAQFLQAPLGDRKAPQILVKKNLLIATQGSSDEELDQLIRENIIVSDDTTAAEDLIVAIEFDRNQNIQKIPVTYRVSDETGNQATAKCWIRIYEGDALTLTLNQGTEGETIVSWEETLVVKKGTQTFTIRSNGEPYRVDQKAGIKTAAQMKKGATVLSSYTENKEQEITVNLDQTGFYTFLITTQGRSTYRFVLYVEK